MKTELRYINLVDDKPIFPEPITSEGHIPIPNEGDTLIHEGWGYIVSIKEYSYEQGLAKITIYCSPEKKKRNV